MKRIITIALLILTTALCSCGIFDLVKIVNTEEPTESTAITEEITTETTTETVTEELTTEKPTEVVTEEATEVIEETGPTFLGGYIFPTTDGPSCTTKLDKAVRKALLGTADGFTHTINDLRRLISGDATLLFTPSLSDDELNIMASNNFVYETAPIAREGFVFFVNKDNPVDTLTVEQIQGIYSGEITNWSEVGGDDAQIIAYQRNDSTEVQRYMRDFMGDTQMIAPITTSIPVATRYYKDVTASYKNDKYAIGYAAYSYSDGAYEDISGIKYLKVNGVEASLEAMADGSYPLLGYSYAVFSADESEDSGVRALVKWIQSDEGQQVLADAGYIPYRQVDGLVLPEETCTKPYYATSTSDIEKPERVATTYYDCFMGDNIEALKLPGLENKVRDFISSAKAELSLIDPQAPTDFAETRYGTAYSVSESFISTSFELFNGYLSVIVGIDYYQPHESGKTHYYDVRTAVFDIYTGERLEFSDLFFKGVDFVPLVNNYLKEEVDIPYFGTTGFWETVNEFKGLREGEFEFTASSIIFKPGVTFADGIKLPIYYGLSEYMVTSLPRDMDGYIDLPVYIKMSNVPGINVTEEVSAPTTDGSFNTYITVSRIDPEKAPVPKEVSNKVNAYLDSLLETFSSEEKLIEIAKSYGVEADSARLGDVGSPVIGAYLTEGYYFTVTVPYSIIAVSGETENEIVINKEYTDYAYLDPETGDMLKIESLFKDGWRHEMRIVYDDDNFNRYDKSSGDNYKGNGDIENGRITAIVNFKESSRSPKEAICVYMKLDNGDDVVVVVPTKYR